MQIGYIQIFDTQADAMQALGYMTTTFPEFDHSLAKTCNQVQVQATVKGTTTLTPYGDLNAGIVYVVASLPKDA